MEEIQTSFRMPPRTAFSRELEEFSNGGTEEFSDDLLDEIAQKHNQTPEKDLPGPILTFDQELLSEASKLEKYLERYGAVDLVKVFRKTVQKVKDGLLSSLEYEPTSTTDADRTMRQMRYVSYKRFYEHIKLEIDDALSTPETKVIKL